MELKEFQEKFKSLPFREGVRFIYRNIASLGEKERALFLLPLIQDEGRSPTLRAATLKFLRRTEVNRAGVFEKCLNDRHPVVVKAAQKAMSDYEAQNSGNGLIIKSILGKIQSTPDKQRRLRTLKAIAKLQASWVPKVLLEAFTDPSEDVRDQIAAMLGKREPLDLSLIYPKLVKSPWFVKSTALKVLAWKKNPDSVREIERILGDTNVDVRRNATLALGEIGGKDALRLLVLLSKDRSSYVRTAAEAALRNASRVKFC